MPSETIAGGSRNCRSNTKPAGSARPEVTAGYRRGRLSGDFIGRRTIVVLILALTAGLLAGCLTIARVAAITYNMRADDPMMLQSGIISAEAMAWRDARG